MCVCFIHFALLLTWGYLFLGLSSSTVRHLTSEHEYHWLAVRIPDEHKICLKRRSTSSALSAHKPFTRATRSVHVYTQADCFGHKLALLCRSFICKLDYKRSSEVFATRSRSSKGPISAFIVTFSSPGNFVEDSESLRRSALITSEFPNPSHVILVHACVGWRFARDIRS